MQVYYLGNPIEKSRKLKAIAGAVYLDNDEVLAAFSKRGRLHFVVGRASFWNFSVWEFLSYTKSLELRRPLKLCEARECLAKVGLDIDINKKLRSFDIITQKAIRLSVLLKPDTTKIALNFDGTRFSRANSQKMQRLIATLGACDLSISVSDTRFVPSGSDICWCVSSPNRFKKPKILKKGKSAKKLPQFFCSSTLDLQCL